jgi:apolipoprotein N-acyltransferase
MDARGPKATITDGAVPNRLGELLAGFARICQPASVRRQNLTSFAAGVVSILAMAPFHLWPVLWLTLPALLLLLDGAARLAPPRTRWTPWRRWAAARPAEIGWWFGFGYHLVGLFWIGEAFLVEAEVFLWLLPVAVTLLPAGLALFTAAATASLSAMLRLAPADRILMLALGFGVTEWLRGHILTGFPWNVLGYALTWPLPLMQSASVLGIYGLTVLTVLIFATPYWLLTSPSNRHARWAALAGPLGLALLAAAGQWRLSAHPIQLPEPSAPVIRIVQPSISQRERMQAENQRRVFDRHLDLSRTNPSGAIDGALGIDVLIWPEAAMPFVPLAQPIALAEIGNLLEGKRRLVSGALRVGQDMRFGGRSVFNSLLVFEGASPAAAVGIYDKIHLVPFGEYLPAQALLEAIGLQQITRQRGGFAAGAGPRALLAIPGLGRVVPLICYEAIFPGQVPKGEARADLLLTLTNDGWFGVMTGPRQHYHQGRVRAVETGVPLLRASSNGISALVDPLGRERARLELNAVGTFDVQIPLRVATTFYARFGDWLVVLLMSSIATLLLLKRGKIGLKLHKISLHMP